MIKEKLNKILNDPSLGYEVKRVDTSLIVNSEFIKKLRNDLGMTQNVFSSVIGVSLKTVEKWEQNIITPRKMTQNFLYLIYKHPEIIKSIYNPDFMNEKHKALIKEDKQTYHIHISINNDKKQEPIKNSLFFNEKDVFKYNYKNSH